MSVPVLTTKLFIPTLRQGTILRPRLIEKLNKGLQGKLTLISASAGFGKTTLVSAWSGSCGRPVLWLSLDEEHKDPMRFLTYLIAALQSIDNSFCNELLIELQSPQSPELDSIIPNILNGIAAFDDDFILVLDDYHILDNKDIDDILTLFIKNMPPQMHLVLSTREDPHLPLAAMRVKGQLSELRVSDLRFTEQEVAAFLNEMMKLNLSNEDIAALETRTEGWIAGLQLAAIYMNGNQNSSSFIESFTGSHYFVLDYLIEEVLNQQTGDIQSFLIRTSILERLSGPLCDALLNDPAGSGQKTLKYLEQLNMFIIPLDSERLWYRYHHLFAELLRQKLQSSQIDTADLHIRASRWFEDNNMYLEAFQHSTAAKDIERTIRLLEGNGIPRSSRRTVSLILNWLQSLPEEVMNRRPLLWITFGSVLLGMGQITGVEQKLLAAERILSKPGSEGGDRDLIGRIASMRAMIAVTAYDAETIYKQSLKALEYLDSSNLLSRIASTWTLGQAYEQKGDLAEAKKTYLKAISIGKSSDNFLFAIISEAGLGKLLEGENKLHEAADMYKKVLEQVGNQPLPILCDVYLGLARINYQWNNLEEARSLGEKGLHLARKFEKKIDRFILIELFLVQLSIAEGDMAQASSLLSGIAKTVQQETFNHRKPLVVEMQILLKIKQGNLREASFIVEKNSLPLCRTRLYLVEGNASGALKALEPLYLRIDDEKRESEKLRIKLLQAMALNDSGRGGMALQIISEILIDLEPEGFIRIFVDEGLPMYRLLSEAAARGIMQKYAGSILSEFNMKKTAGDQPLIEPLSHRELEVLALLSQGLSNKEICDKLFIALDTVKGHNRKIFAKLDVKTRTLAISKARDLNILG